MRQINQIKLPTSPQQPPPKVSKPLVEQRKHMPIPKNMIILIAGILICLTALGSLYILPANKKKQVAIKLGIPAGNESPTRPSPTLQPSVTPDPTANWKSYANKSFSIRFPERFTVNEKTVPFNTQYPKVYSSITFSDAVSDIVITVAKNAPNLVLANALGNGPYLRYSPSLITKAADNIQIDGNDGKMAQSISTGGAGTRSDIIVIAYGKVYEMTISPIGVDPQVFGLMLSTMKLLNQEPADITDDWPIHVDNNYKFSFRNPTNYIVEYGKVSTGSPYLTMVYDNSKIILDAPRFKIEVQDIKNFGQSAITSREILQLPLNQFVDKKWEYNKNATDSAIPNRIIGPIKQTAVDGKVAYSFTVTGKYIDDHTQEILSSEYTFVFTENNGYKYKIWFPTNDTTETQIFNTFKFLQ